MAEMHNVSSDVLLFKKFTVFKHQCVFWRPDLFVIFSVKLN